MCSFEESVRRMRRFRALLWAFSLPLIGALSACDRASGNNDPPAAPVARVRIVKVDRRDIVRSVKLPGTVRGDLEVTLYSKVAGFVKSIGKDRGDKVSEGEKIAQLEVPELQDELARDQAQYDLEEKTVNRLEAIRKMESSAVTDQDLDLAKAKKSVAKANLERVKTMIGYTEIRAPFGGYVSERFVDPGAFVQQGRIVSIVNAKKVRVLVDIPEPEVRFAGIGTKVEVSFEGLSGKPFPAEIKRSSTALDPATRTMRVEVDVENPKGAILPGMYAHVSFEMERRRDALAVPAKALIQEKDKCYVFVDHEGTAQKVCIRPGTSDGEWVETVEGLTGTESVILPGAQGLKEGMRIQGVQGS